MPTEYVVLPQMTSLEVALLVMAAFPQLLPPWRWVCSLLGTLRLLGAQSPSNKPPLHT